MSIVVSDMQKNSNTIAPKYLHILEMLMFMLGFVSIKTETNKTTNEPTKKYSVYYLENVSKFETKPIDDNDTRLKYKKMKDFLTKPNFNFMQKFSKFDPTKIS